MLYWIKSLKQNFLIDSLLIKNTKLVYVHKAEAAKEGFLKFSNLNATILGLTDIDSLLLVNPYLDLVVNSKFWDQGDLNINFRMDLSSPVDRIYVTGSLKNLPFKKAENMVKPLYGIEITSGQIEDLAFNFTMDENIGKGNLKFDYKDLKVDVKAQDKKEKKEGNETKYTEKSVGLFNFAIGEAVRSSNMPGDPKYKPEGIIIVDRTKIKPVFDLLWNCLANGMMDVAIKDFYYNSKKNYDKKQKKEAKKAAKKNEKLTKKRGGLFKKKKE